MNSSSLSLCHRCGSKRAAAHVFGVNVCRACALALQHRFGSASVAPVAVGALSDVTPLGAVVPALGLYQLAEGGSPSSPGAPSSPGSPGSGGFDLFGLKQTGSNVSRSITSFAETVKVVALAAAGLGAAVLLFSLWRAHEAEKHAIGFVEKHPEVLAL